MKQRAGEKNLDFPKTWELVAVQVWHKKKEHLEGKILKFCSNYILKYIYFHSTKARNESKTIKWLNQVPWVIPTQVWAYVW